MNFLQSIYYENLSLYFILDCVANTESPISIILWSKDINQEIGIGDSSGGSGNLLILTTANDEIIVSGNIAGDIKFLRYDTTGSLLHRVDEYVSNNMEDYRRMIYFQEEQNGDIISILSSGEIFRSDGTGINNILISKIEPYPDQLSDNYHLLSVYGSVIYVSNFDQIYKLINSTFDVIEVNSNLRDSLGGFLIMKREFLNDNSYFDLFHNNSSHTSLIQYFTEDGTFVWEVYDNCEDRIGDIFVTDNNRIYVSSDECVPGASDSELFIAEIDINGNILWSENVQFANKINIVGNKLFVYGGFNSTFGNAGSFSEFTLDGDIILTSHLNFGNIIQLELINGVPITIEEQFFDDRPWKSFLVYFGEMTSSAMDNSYSNFTFFPNPVIDRLYIEFEETSTGTLSIANVDSKIIHREKLNDRSADIDIGDIASGVYFLTFTNKAGRRESHRFIRL